MTLEELQTLQSLAQKARQDFKVELQSKGTYASLEKVTGLSSQQLFRIVNEQGQPKLETLVNAYIKLHENKGAD